MLNALSFEPNMDGPSITHPPYEEQRWERFLMGIITWDHSVVSQFTINGLLMCVQGDERQNEQITHIIRGRPFGVGFDRSHPSLQGTLLCLSTSNGGSLQMPTFGSCRQSKRSARQT
jgi:hypothetical protein